MMKMSTNNAVPTNNEIQKQQAIQALHFAQITNDYQQCEPPPVCRRLITSSHATISNALNCA
jgi:hypothetical protein